MEIRTERLLLRPVTPGDLATAHAYASDLENTRYMVFLPNKSLEETRRFLNDAAAQWLKPKPDYYEFAVVREGVHIGGISLFRLEDGSAELGWILDKRCWGNGYALEAARALMEHARREWGFRRFIAQCDGENAASYRLMERLGMRRIGETGGRKNRSSPEERTELTYEIAFED